AEQDRAGGGRRGGHGAGAAGGGHEFLDGADGTAIHLGHQVAGLEVARRGPLGVHLLDDDPPLAPALRRAPGGRAHRDPERSARTTRPWLRSCGSIRLTRLIGIAKPMPCALSTMAVFRPITSPRRL